jgi:hypothetical protein
MSLYLSKFHALAHRRMAFSDLHQLQPRNSPQKLQRPNEHCSHLGSARRCSVNGVMLVPILSLAYIDSRDITVRSSCALAALPPVGYNSSIKHSRELSPWVA